MRDEESVVDSSIGTKKYTGKGYRNNIALGFHAAMDNAVNTLYLTMIALTPRLWVPSWQAIAWKWGGGELWLVCEKQRTKNAGSAYNIPPNAALDHTWM